jgi:hypothetical protein
VNAEPVTPGYVVAALQLATLTLMALPPGGHGTGLAQGRNDVVQDIAEAYGYTAQTVRPAVPPAGAITAMDEVHGWLRFVPNRVTRRIISLRSLTRSSGDPKSWRSIGAIVGAHPMSIKTWHERGILQIVVALNQGHGGHLPAISD